MIASRYLCFLCGYTAGCLPFSGFQEVGGGVKEPKGIIYNDEDLTDVQSTYSENVTTSGVANGSSMEICSSMFFMFFFVFSLSIYASNVY